MELKNIKKLASSLIGAMDGAYITVSSNGTVAITGRAATYTLGTVDAGIVGNYALPKRKKDCLAITELDGLLTDKLSTAFSGNELGEVSVPHGMKLDLSKLAKLAGLCSDEPLRDDLISVIIGPDGAFASNGSAMAIDASITSETVFKLNSSAILNLASYGYNELLEAGSCFITTDCKMRIHCLEVRTNIYNSAIAIMAKSVASSVPCLASYEQVRGYANSLVDKLMAKVHGKKSGSYYYAQLRLSENGEQGGTLVVNGKVGQVVDNYMGILTTGYCADVECGLLLQCLRLYTSTATMAIVVGVSSHKGLPVHGLVIRQDSLYCFIMPVLPVGMA